MPPLGCAHGDGGALPADAGANPGCGAFGDPWGLGDLDDDGGVLTAQPSAATGDFTWGVAIGDLDGDGQNDLAAVAHYPGQLALRRSGGAAETLQIGTLPKAVATGHISPDGFADVVAAASDRLFVRLHTPTGNLSAAIPVGSGLRRVVLGDLDGDGIDDIVAIDETTRTLVTLLSNP